MDRLWKLYDAVREIFPEKGYVESIYITIKTAVKKLLESFATPPSSNVVKIGDNRWEVSYVIDGKTYKKLVRPRRGPPPIFRAIDHDDNDVTSCILPYLGPAADWNGIKYTPGCLKYKRLKIELMDGRLLEFEECEKIAI